MNLNYLANLSKKSIEEDKIPLDAILQDSLYYPSSGLDGDPVRHFSNLFNSYVYVDYGVKQKDLIAELDRGFNGYYLYASRDVTREDLSYDNWRPPVIRRNLAEALERCYEFKDVSPVHAFCKWMVFEKHDDSKQGPARFSLLYLNADGVAAFHALYYSRNIAPKGIAIIQPGEGFGGNWTFYRDTEDPLYQFVSTNKGGMPKYLIFGGYAHEVKRTGWIKQKVRINYKWIEEGYYDSPPWPEYNNFHGYFRKFDESNNYISMQDVSGVLGLWSR